MQMGTRKQQWTRGAPDQASQTVHATGSSAHPLHCLSAVHSIFRGTHAPRQAPRIPIRPTVKENTKGNSVVTDNGRWSHEAPGFAPTEAQ